MASHTTNEFSGKRILVTGAGRGIGRQLSLSLASKGAEVYAISRSKVHLESLEKESASIRTFAQDVADWDALRKLIETFPPMNGVVNNAGIGGSGDALTISEEKMDQVFAVNFKSAINATQATAAKMSSGGSIVNVSSQASIIALPAHLAYGCSKAALDHATKQFALELGPKGIRVNSVNPTVVMTDMAKAYWGGERGEKLLERMPMGKFAEIKDVVNAIEYLLSDKSELITGVALPIDGGITCC